MEKEVRVRYAPSPTGHLHIGGARTALFNYLFAKHNNGKFIFRLEDTDSKRNIEGGEASQLDNLIWLNIIPDESPTQPGAYGPYRQTQRLDIYQKYAEELIDRGLAYRCFCTNEELDEMRAEQEKAGIYSFRYDKRCSKLSKEEEAKLLDEGKEYSIRFNVNADTTYKWNDIVRKEVSFEGKDISDWVIIKSNGIATYNFAVAVDDHLMEISHVFRGEEHISNTPKQLMVYEAFGWEPPTFGHLTLIVNEARKKLSKRDETIMQFVSQYRESGFLPDAMFNFFSLLGWSPEGEEEIFTKEEIIEQFNVSRLSKSPSMFDKKKLYWLNNHYIKNLDENESHEFLKEFLTDGYDLTNKSDEWINKVIDLFKPQINYGAEIIELVKPFFIDKEVSKEDLTLLREMDAEDLLKLIKEKFNNLIDFNAENIKLEINDAGVTLSKKGKNLFMPIRLAVFGSKSGADLASAIELSGKEKAVNNIERVLSQL